MRLELFKVATELELRLARCSPLSRPICTAGCKRTLLAISGVFPSSSLWVLNAKESIQETAKMRLKPVQGRPVEG